MVARSTATGMAMEKLRRLAVTAVAADLDLEPLRVALARLNEESFREILVAVDETFGHLEVQHRWPRQEPAREAVFDFHASNFPEHNDRVMPLLDRSGRAPLIEWRSDPGAPLGCTIHSVGARPIEDDLDLVIELARANDIARVAMGAIGEPLAAVTSGQCDGVADQLFPNGSSRWSLRFVLANDTPRAMAGTMEVIERIARALDVTESQRQAFMTMHPQLSGRRPTIASISLSDGGRDQKVGVEYAPAAWTSALRLMQSFGSGWSPERRLRALRAGTAAPSVAMLRLELRNTEPPGLRVWAELTRELGAGRP